MQSLPMILGRRLIISLGEAGIVHHGAHAWGRSEGRASSPHGSRRTAATGGGSHVTLVVVELPGYAYVPGLARVVDRVTSGVSCDHVCRLQDTAAGFRLMPRSVNTGWFDDAEQAGTSDVAGEPGTALSRSALGAVARRRAGDSPERASAWACASSAASCRHPHRLADEEGVAPRIGARGDAAWLRNRVFSQFRTLRAARQRVSYLCKSRLGHLGKLTNCPSMRRPRGALPDADRSSAVRRSGAAWCLSLKRLAPRIEHKVEVKERRRARCRIRTWGGLSIWRCP